jgi:hypothetical protein
MADVKMPHPGHDKHLCYLTNLDFHNDNAEEYRELVKEPQFFCKNCGRAAAKEQNLCNPVKM